MPHMTIFSAMLSYDEWLAKIPNGLENPDISLSGVRYVLSIINLGIADEADMRRLIKDPDDSWLIESTPVLQRAHETVAKLKEYLAWRIPSTSTTSN